MTQIRLYRGAINDIAKRLGITRQTVSNVLKGKDEGYAESTIVNIRLVAKELAQDAAKETVAAIGK